ncbi:MAG: DNA double-strand break repair nuclease NurA [Acidimicrobiia bacterium]
MRFSVETWAPEYGAPIESEMDDSTTPVDVGVELAADAWRPLEVDIPPAPEVVFVDGVRRIDANVWIDDETDPAAYGVCATYAAGAVRCNGSAEIVEALVERSLFTPARTAEPIDTRHGTYGVVPTVGSAPEDLWIGIQKRMALLEGRVSASLGGSGLVVVDGPLSHHQQVEGAVGYVKTQHVHHLPPDLRPILRTIPVGRRTPVFMIGGTRQVFSWYLRLASIGGPMSGVVRCEVAAVGKAADAIARADKVTATLPRFASQEHKDPRAPQNLYPIGGLERELRRRLGDQMLMYRALRRAAS